MVLILIRLCSSSSNLDTIKAGFRPKDAPGLTEYGGPSLCMFTPSVY